MVKSYFHKKKSYINWKYKNGEYNPLLVLIQLFPLSKHWGWDCENILANPNMTLKYILQYPYKNWNYTQIFNIWFDQTIHFLKKVKIIPYTFLDFKKCWNWRRISKNPNITFGDILQHPELPWNWDGVSENPNITISDILNHSKPWNWNIISRNSNITMTDILAHPELPWNWSEISDNPNITLKNILQHPKRPWNWGAVSTNVNITLRDILAYPELPWDWDGVNYNPNITLTDILQNPKLPWRHAFVNLDFRKNKKNITATDILKKYKEKNIGSGYFLHFGQRYYPENLFLWENDIYRKTLKADIKTRRNEIICLNLFGSLKGVISKYIGYV